MNIADVLNGIKRYTRWYYLLLKRLIKKPGVWILCILFPILAITACNFQKDNSESFMSVGLIVNNNDEVAYNTAQHLINGGYPVKFYIADSEEKMAESIINNEDVCGYIFCDNLKERLDSKNLKECITIIKPSSDFVSSMINEIVFCELFKTYGSDIAINEIVKSDIFADNTAKAVMQIKEKYQEYADGSNTFHIDFKDINEYQSDNIDNIENNADSYNNTDSYSNMNNHNNTDIYNNVDNHNNIDSYNNTDSYNNADNNKYKYVQLFSIRGVMAIIIAIAGLTGCVWWKSEDEHGLFKAMRPFQKYVGAFLYVVSTAFLIGIIAIVVIFITNSQVYSVIGEILKMLLYIIAIGIMGTVLCIIIRDRLFLTSFIPVYAILCFIVCPVFIDISAIIPPIRYLQKLLLPYYMII